MLSTISITSFRGIAKITLILGPRTYIMGKNGSGKTHVLDAIHILAGSRPLYGDTRLESGTEFEGTFVVMDLEKRYRMIRDDIREYYSVQSTKITKPKYLQALPFRTVHISPFDMNLLYFAPSIRREYIDLVLSRTHEQFPKIRREYDQVMRQRNAMLKKIREGLAKREDLDFWDYKFAECADMYGLYRDRYRAYIQGTISKFPAFFGKYDVVFHYESSWIDQVDRRDFIEKYFQENRERDILTGHTHIGPHRDDWGFRIRKHREAINVESYLSR